MNTDLPLHTHSEILDGVAVLHLEGELVSQSRFVIERILREWLELGIHQVIVGLAALRYIDSSGLATLLGALHRCRREGGDIILVELNPSLEAIFEITSMARYFRIFPTMADARRQFAPADTATDGGRQTGVAATELT